MEKWLFLEAIQVARLRFDRSESHIPPKISSRDVASTTYKLRISSIVRRPTIKLTVLDYVLRFLAVGFNSFCPR